VSIVAVHGPNTMYASGAGGAGTGEVITAPGGGGGNVVADADMANGQRFTFSWVGTTARPNADFDWAFPGGTPATATDTKGPVTVTYATGGSKVATLTVAAGAGPPAGGSYPITVQATATAMPRSLPGGGEEPPPESGYDPGDYTIPEVEDYVTANPGERDAVLAAEEAGKARVTLIAWLEAFEVPEE
jgi:hypothetical protein